MNNLVVMMKWKSYRTTYKTYWVGTEWIDDFNSIKSGMNKEEADIFMNGNLTTDGLYPSTKFKVIDLNKNE